MKTEQSQWSLEGGWRQRTSTIGGGADLVWVFGSVLILEDQRTRVALAERYPGAYVCGCSTAGEILGDCVFDDLLCVTAVQFEGTTFRAVEATVSDAAQSFAVGNSLAESLVRDGLVHVFVLSDGLGVNGTELVRGLRSGLPTGITVTGGLAGDGTRFARTVVCGGGSSEPKKVVVLGFYGSRLRVGFGCMGGWDPFGPERTVTRAKGNILYELDGHSALALYKQYLGDHAADLPASGLLFPLSLEIPDTGESLVRTILAVNDSDQSMTFAGDIPEGYRVQLMKANFDRLIDGARGAASNCLSGVRSPELAILISCVGRRLVLRQRIEEELEGVQRVLGSSVALAGFYSYGEISPLVPLARCELHNQTMTITAFAEC